MISIGKKFYFFLLLLVGGSYSFAQSSFTFSHRFVPPAQTVVLFSDKGFVCNGKDLEGIIVRITFKKNSVYINGKQFHEQNVSLVAKNNEFMLGQEKYTGGLQLGYYKKAWHVVHTPAPIDFKLALQKQDEHEPVTKQDARYQVRVLLAEQERRSMQDSWMLSCKSGFILFDPIGSSKWYVRTESLVIHATRNGFTLNGIPLTQQRLCIFPIKDHISWNDNQYQGHFLLVYDSQKNYLINVLDIEDYVFSVLRTESWPGWPLEVNKVFAISSRSYVIGVILNTKKAGLPYHVKNTNKHQTYTGFHTVKVLKEAVEQTKGIFIAYDKKPIIAMFDICCGGVVPAHIRGVNFDHSPYLARPYACTYCKGCKCYSWRAEYRLDQLEQKLQKEVSTLKKLKDVTVTKMDKAGLVQEVAVKTHSRFHTITGKKMYSLLDKVKSFCFTVTKKVNTIIFNGYGYGHHLGLCQWGAREMVRLGYDHKYILKYYYPDTNLMRLN